MLISCYLCYNQRQKHKVYYIVCICAYQTELADRNTMSESTLIINEVTKLPLQNL